MQNKRYLQEALVLIRLLLQLKAVISLADKRGAFCKAINTQDFHCCPSPPSDVLLGPYCFMINIFSV